MYSPYTRHRREYPNWSPLLGLAHPSHSALRTLRLIGYYLPDRHLWAFWAICERLEVLEMEGVDFKMPHIMVPGARKLNASPNPNSLGSKHQDVVMRFPKLRELKLIESSPTNGLAQLEGIIRQCPNLTTLHWKVRQYGYFPRTRLIYLFTGIQGNYIPLDFQHSIQLLRCASPSWPRLTSITIERHPHEAFNLEDYLTIAQTVKGLRKLELGVLAIEPNVVQTLLARHSIRFARSICEICAMKVFPNGS
ncbi:hypothetical protein EDD21DRAFT_6794 [Dissophora ornata]|nr:hypothetical protein EDD21DRAFT_6794 [Dissophora ornata]